MTEMIKHILHLEEKGTGGFKWINNKDTHKQHVRHPAV